MVSSAVWNTVPGVCLLAAAALPATSRMRQINIASPVQEYGNYVYAQRRQQRAAQGDVEEQPDSQQSRELRLAAKTLQERCLRAGELQQLLDAGKCNFAAGASRPYLCQCPDQGALVAVGNEVRTPWRRADAEQQGGFVP